MSAPSCLSYYSTKHRCTMGELASVTTSAKLTTDKFALAIPIIQKEPA